MIGDQEIRRNAKKYDEMQNMKTGPKAKHFSLSERYADEGLLYSQQVNFLHALQLSDDSNNAKWLRTNCIKTIKLTL